MGKTVTANSIPLVPFREMNHGIHPLVARGLNAPATLGEYGIITADGRFHNLTQFQPARATFRPAWSADDHIERRRLAAQHDGKIVVGVIDHGPSATSPGARRLGVLFADGQSYWAVGAELHGLTVDHAKIAEQIAASDATR